MKAPISGQYMARNISVGRAGCARASGGRERARPTYACSATCSWGDGNAHATCSLRSWRNTNRIWLGGRRPSGWAGRKVGQGPVSDSAQRRFW